MLLLSREDIKKVFTMKEAIEIDKKGLMIETQGKSVVPLRTVIPAKDGAFLFMPAFVEEMGVASLKNVNIFSKNYEKGLPTAPAQVLLIDGHTGMIIALLDGAYVTQLRTGASTGAAFDVLARKDAKTGALIGTGGQAATQLEAMLAVRSLDEVRVYDTDIKRAEAFVTRMKEELSAYPTRIVVASSSDDAIEDADLVVTVTPSTVPVFDGKKIKVGATVSCVGSYLHHMQEMGPDVLVRASKIFFDSQEAVLSESGDILIPLEQGLITEADFNGNIGEVLLGHSMGRENDDEIIVYKNVGFGTLDLVTAKAIYEKALKESVGTTWG